jgi:hypothetical protein
MIRHPAECSVDIFKWRIDPGIDLVDSPEKILVFGFKKLPKLSMLLQNFETLHPFLKVSIKSLTFCSDLKNIFIFLNLGFIEKRDKSLSPPPSPLNRYLEGKIWFIPGSKILTRVTTPKMKMPVFDNLGYTCPDFFLPGYSANVRE